MVLPDTHALLESIADTTRQQDSRDFRASMLKTVLEAIRADRAAFVRRLAPGAGASWHEELSATWQGDGDARIPCLQGGDTLADDDGLLACAGDAVARCEVLADGSARYLLPVRDGNAVEELVIVTTRRAEPGDFRLVAAIVQLYQNYLDLARAGERDTLTGLLNRRTLESRVGRFLQKAAAPARRAAPSGAGGPARRCCDRSGHVPKAHWLALVDIDHFKRINDRFGHLFGDEVLLLVARLMRESFRLNDLLFRFGGEEFVVIIDADREADAVASFERFRRQVEAHRFPQLDHLTVSVGYVRLGAHMVFGDAVGHADQALYYAKAHGRNRICGYEQLRARRALPETPLNSSVELF